MRLLHPAHAELTYCTNVHPGETLPEVRAALRQHVLAVKARVASEHRFGVGLRLSAAAADALAEPGELERFAAELDAAKLYCVTLNGFPYGAFHATEVKERVYLPDFRDPERVRYTRVLSRVLAALLPPGQRGSISTVPGCFKPEAAEPDAPFRMAASLVEVAATLVELEREHGQHITLGLEPEPHCFLETSTEAVHFFEACLLAAPLRKQLVESTGIAPADAERTLRRHLGICLDTCHASVEFETPLSAFRALGAAGISVPKVQLSAGLRLARATPEGLSALGAFASGVYLHQTVVRRGEQLLRFVDLPQALASSQPVDSEWRVHFHVPIFLRELGPFESTQDDLVPLLLELSRSADCPHLEVETYTWDVLPEAHRNVPVDEAIARELKFVLDTLGTAPAGSAA